MEMPPPEALLEGYPVPMRALAEALRRVVRRTRPEALERVRPGWRLIGYDLPTGPRRTAFFCYVAPEDKHVHLGFPQGVFMDDPEQLLHGAGITVRTRWLTLRPGDALVETRLAGLVQEAARVALLGRSGRLAALLDREAAADARPPAVLRPRSPAGDRPDSWPGR